jgi:hypothetical protein
VLGRGCFRFLELGATSDSQRTDPRIGDRQGHRYYLHGKARVP